MAKLGFESRFFKELIAADSLGRGQAEFKKENYEKAFNILKPVADYEFNDAYVGGAQLFVGLMYYYGHFVGKDEVIARRYLDKAIENENEYAKKFLKEINRRE